MNSYCSMCVVRSPRALSARQIQPASPDETKWSPGRILYEAPDCAMLHPGYDITLNTGKYREQNITG
jgi:hypothetical protein